MKKGRKAAVRLFQTETQARQHADHLIISNTLHTQANTYLEERPGEAIRCEHFCKVAQWCHQKATEEQTRRMMQQLDKENPGQE